MINKDKSITNLIECLNLELNLNLIQIVDYWEADLCAIGLKKDNKLIYISTYNYEFQTFKYDYDLEILNDKKQDDINVIKEVRSASQKDLIKEIKCFLQI